ncbi:MAG: RNA polymerase sigma factor RpoE [Gammaproteobacteria bacterium]|jgi:RNA polymerase sigma-70 factor (ECF subfamily)|nr:RNA polymerase sigma factor RpoE [Gammaproteobacteria bacterium]
MAVTDGDQLLVERAQRGDRGAFDLLVLKYQQKILKLVMRFVRDPADALDVSQEAFIKAYRALPAFRGDSAFYTWLYRIAINAAKNHLAAVQRKPPEQELDSQDPDHYASDARLRDEESPEGLVMQEQLRQTIARAMESLPDELRTAIVLREIEGLSYEEIAQAMDCPVGTVRSRIFRAREAIDASIGPMVN